ncbi:hypothetical protein Daus18300_011311 [Diaporthe australafricana]|uniref:Integral membrane protein n=1 Tax=Diaporthe australafricana TaxID=127596 RepID=A0ABR3W792_9PEZI
MAFPRQNEPFGAFNPFDDVRPDRNAPAPQPPRPFNFGPNRFNQANRAERFANGRAPGINPPFVFNPQPRGPAWNARGNGQWGMNTAPPMPNRTAAYPEDRAYMRFQARALRQPPAVPAPPPAAPAPMPPAAPPAPPAIPPVVPPAPPAAPPAAPAPIPPVAPPAPPAPPLAPLAPAAAGQGQQAAGREMYLGRTGNAGTGRNLDVPPLLVYFNEWRALINLVRTALVELVARTRAIVWATCGLILSLVNFVVRWVIFLFVVTLALRVCLPLLMCVLDGMMNVPVWLFNSGPTATTECVTYVLGKVWIGRAVTGLPYGASSAVRPGESIPGPPYGSTAVTSGFSLLYSLSLDPITLIWSVLLTLVIAPVFALFCAVLIGILLGV